MGDNYIISKDIDRISFITASVTGFFFVCSWVLYGVNKVVGEETDWTPMCYSVLCRKRGARYYIDDDNDECYNKTV
jgi:hypothetical protein